MFYLTSFAASVKNILKILSTAYGCVMGSKVFGYWTLFLAPYVQKFSEVLVNPFLETVRRARELLQEFRDVQVRPSRTSVQRMRQKWMPPGLGVYKLNFDGAIFEGSARAGSGVVVRDAEGMIIAALSQNIQLPSSVDLVEALAAWRAILFAQELCLAHVVVEGDSLKVITAINNPQKNRTQWDHVIEDIKGLFG